MGLLGDVSIPPAGKPVGWQAGPARSLPRCGLGGGLSICLSVSGGKLSSRRPPCLIGSSVPSQLDEEEERRKRRREKNKVAAARCRNKKKERTEFLQRVSRAGAGRGEAPGSLFRAGSCTRGPGDVTKACGIDVHLLASVHAATTPLFFSASYPVPFP